MSWKGHVRFWGEKGGVIQFPTYPTNKGNINKIENNKFNNNTPANFIIEENKIKLVQNDGFISIGDFTIVTDDGEIRGNGNLDSSTISSYSKNVKLILNGTNTITVNNTFILGESEEIYEQLIDTQTNLTIINTSLGNTIVKVTVQDENGEVISNGDISITDENGQIITTGFINKNNESILILNLPYGEYNITAVYSGNQTHTRSINQTSIKVKHRTNIKIDVINPIEENLTAIITLTDENNQPAQGQQVNITLPNSTIITKITDNEGKILLTEVNASVGLANIIVNKTESDDYSSAIQTQQTYSHLTN